MQFNKCPLLVKPSRAGNRPPPSGPTCNKHPSFTKLVLNSFCTGNLRERCFFFFKKSVCSALSLTWKWRVRTLLLLTLNIKTDCEVWRRFESTLPGECLQLWSLREWDSQNFSLRFSHNRLICSAPDSVSTHAKISFSSQLSHLFCALDFFCHQHASVILRWVSAVAWSYVRFNFRRFWMIFVII